MSLSRVDEMNEQDCYHYLVTLLHPDGLRCPSGHPLPDDQAPHDRRRAPVVDYRCRTCGAVYNIFTDTIWSKTRYSCKTIVLILRGVSEERPTLRLSSELGLDRSHLSKRRQAIQSLIDTALAPFEPGRRHSQNQKDASERKRKGARN